MKRSQRGLIAAIFIISLWLTGCFGSFGASTTVYDWNEGVTSNKYAQSAVMWGLVIIPVYEVALALDFFIFNNPSFGQRILPSSLLERGV